MNCKEAEALVMPYIHDDLSDEQLEGFFNHIKTCKNCREELEIYYTVEVGIRQLESEGGNYNIKGALESMLAQTEDRLHGLKLLKVFRYAVTSLSFMAFLLSFLLQLRIWIQNGLF